MIETEKHGNISILRMVRGKGNALNLDLMKALSQSLDEIEHSPTSAAVITGQGSVFGAGVDLTALLEGGPDYVRLFIPAMLQGFERLVTFPKPLVAAVNGHAIAGGAILVLACDQRIAARGTARIGLTEIQVGVQFPAWALEIARYRTPPEHFSTLILTGRTWQPDDALARGLVDEVVEPEQLIGRACEVAEELGAIPGATFAATKREVRRPLVEAARLRSRDDAAVIEDWCSPDVLKHIGQFVARTVKRKA